MNSTILLAYHLHMIRDKKDNAYLLSSDYMDRVFQSDDDNYLDLEEMRERRKEAARKLWDIMYRLDARTLMVYQMYYQEGLSQAEIALWFGVSQQQVSNRLKAIDKKKEGT